MPDLESEGLRFDSWQQHLHLADVIAVDYTVAYKFSKLFSLFLIPSIEWDVKPRPQLCQIVKLSTSLFKRIHTEIFGAIWEETNGSRGRGLDTYLPDVAKRRNIDFLLSCQTAFFTAAVCQHLCRLVAGV